MIVVGWYLFARRIPLGGIHPGQDGDGHPGHPGQDGQDGQER